MQDSGESQILLWHVSPLQNGTFFHRLEQSLEEFQDSFRHYFHVEHIVDSFEF